MRRLLPAAILLLAALTAVAALPAWGQIEPPSTLDVQGRRTVTVYSNGTALVEEEISFSAEAFVRFKQAYNPISTFVRELEPRSSPYQITGLSISLDEANNRLTARYKLLGAAVYKGDGRWWLRVAEPGESVTLSHAGEREAVLTIVYAAGEGFRVMETVNVKLPEGASNPQLHQDSGVLEYTMPMKAGTVQGLARIAGIGLAAAGAVIIALGVAGSRRAPPSVAEIESRISGGD